MQYFGIRVCCTYNWRRKGQLERTVAPDTRALDCKVLHKIKMEQKIQLDSDSYGVTLLQCWVILTGESWNCQQPIWTLKAHSLDMVSSERWLHHMTSKDKIDSQGSDPYLMALAGDPIILDLRRPTSSLTPNLNLKSQRLTDHLTNHGTPFQVPSLSNRAYWIDNRPSPGRYRRSNAHFQNISRNSSLIPPTTFPIRKTQLFTKLISI